MNDKKMGIVISVTKCKAALPLWERLQWVIRYALGREITFTVEVSKEQATEFLRQFRDVSDQSR